MRFKGKSKKKDKQKQKDAAADSPALKTEQQEKEIIRPHEEKRLYVQCSSMVNEQYATDKSLGKIVYINDEEHPILIDNEHFTGHAVFRVRDFDGWTPVDGEGKPKPIIPRTAYFDGHRRTFSIQMSGRFKKPWTGDEVMFGTWFDGKLTLPRGYSIALAFANQIDRSMVHSVDTDQPYICSPLICAMNVVRYDPVFKRSAMNDDGDDEKRTWTGLEPSDGANTTADTKQSTQSQADTTKLSKTDTLDLPEWTWFNGERLEENLLASWPTWPSPPTSSFYEEQQFTGKSVADLSLDDSKAARHRRAWFLNEERRKKFVYHPDVVYSWDFFSPYVDVNRMQLRMGVTIDVSYYLNGQPLKYQARTRDGKVIFFEFVVGLA